MQIGRERRLRDPHGKAQKHAARDGRNPRVQPDQKNERLEHVVIDTADLRDVHEGRHERRESARDPARLRTPHGSCERNRENHQKEAEEDHDGVGHDLFVKRAVESHQRGELPDAGEDQVEPSRPRGNPAVRVEEVRIVDGQGGEAESPPMDLAKVVEGVTILEVKAIGREEAGGPYGTHIGGPAQKEGPEGSGANAGEETDGGDARARSSHCQP